jgi:hypothetical protein
MYDQLQGRLLEVLAVQAEVARAAAPVLHGDLSAPLTQLQHLAETVGSLELLLEQTKDAARDAYRAVQAEYGERSAPV